MRHPFDGLNEATRRGEARTRRSLVAVAAAFAGLFASRSASAVTPAARVTTQALGEEGGVLKPVAPSPTRSYNEGGSAPLKPPTAAGREAGGRVTTEALGEEGGARPPSSAAGEGGLKPKRPV